MAQAPLDGGAPNLLATGLQGPDNPVIAQGFLFFADATPTVSARFLQRISLCAPSGAAPVGPAGLGPGDLVFDGSTVFFTSVQSGSLGFLARLP